jgi:hypothetical protein
MLGRETEYRFGPHRRSFQRTRPGMATVMGALRTWWAAVRIPATRPPRELAEAGEIDILSSDYVPVALLMVPFWLAHTPAVGRGLIPLLSQGAGGGLRRNRGWRPRPLGVAARDREPVFRAVCRRRTPGRVAPRGRSSSAHSGERRISSLTVEARPAHALAHQAPGDASIGGHAVIGDMDPDCVVLI